MISQDIRGHPRRSDYLSMDLGVMRRRVSSMEGDLAIRTRFKGF